MPILVQGIAGSVADILKSTVSLVDIKVVRRGVVRDEKIGFPVAVDVDEDGCQSIVSILISDTRFFAYVCEGSITVIVKEVVWLALETSRTTHNFFATKLAEAVGDVFASGCWLARDVVVNVAGNEEV